MRGIDQLLQAEQGVQQHWRNLLCDLDLGMTASACHA